MLAPERLCTNNQSEEFYAFNRTESSDDKTSLGHSSIYKFIAEGLFPK
ncbi:AlpA family phage regulatory protein [Pseudoalteromonas sp. T1lg122]